VTQASAADTAPELLVVIDTEEEFDWSRPFSRDNVSTGSIPAQAKAQAIFDRLGIVPTYAIDYPVAADPVSAAFFRGLREAGKAEIGAHLHPWVNPPHREEVNRFNSYHCNLPPALERAKLEVLTDAITQAVGAQPTIFKAGRYGFGPSTARTLQALGYQVDCSLLPYSDLRADGGPDFRRAPDQPYWLGEPGGLLEVPVTTGFFGAFPGLGPSLAGLFESRWAARLRLPGILSRSGLVTRSRLTPEGVSVGEQCRLVESLVRRGRRTLSMVYHSPSLEPGHTPYVRSAADLARFLDTLEQVLLHFRDAVGGRFTSMSALHARMAAERLQRPAVADRRFAAATGLRPGALRA
jgi:hypothetical protein